MILSDDAGQAAATAPDQPPSHEGEQPIHLQSSSFSLSLQYLVNYMRYEHFIIKQTLY